MADMPNISEVATAGEKSGITPVGAPGGRACETCGLTRWEGKQVDGYVAELRAEIERLTEVLDGPHGVYAWVNSPQPERNRLDGIKRALGINPNAPTPTAKGPSA